MPSIGPSLPPHLAKRSRDDSDDPDERVPRSPEASEKRRRVLGPAAPPPPASNSRSSSPESDTGPAPPAPPKAVRVVGPAAPPAALSERPPNPPSDDNSDSSDDDDDFGPAPPPAGAMHATYDADEMATPHKSAFDTDPRYTEQAKKVQRDDWMTMPPTQDDLAARMDPTKIRPRKFNSGKGARAPAGGADGTGVWTETPEQKLKRLQNEALGIAAPANASEAGPVPRRSKHEEEQAKKIRKQVEKARGKSLMERHKDQAAGKDKEDDPSARGFDYEKDMGTGMKIGHKQRNDLLKNAKGFGDRFSGGSFL